MMAVINIFSLLLLLTSLVQSLPASPGGMGRELEEHMDGLVAFDSVSDDSEGNHAIYLINDTYTIDYFLVRKELQYALQDVISYKEATTSILDSLIPPAPYGYVATQIRWALDGLRVTAFYAYDKLIFLANSELLTLAYAAQTLRWYERAFFHFTGKIEALILSGEFDDSTVVKLQSLLDQIVRQSNQHSYNIKLLLTPGSV